MVRLVQAGGVRLQLIEAGPPDGEPLILLHGFPETSLAWRRQIEPLAARGFRVIAPDLRGHGGSDAPDGVANYRLDRLAGDVIALADALEIERFALVGHDWGGVIGWAVAAVHPARVRRLVAASAPHPDTFGRTMLRDPGQVLRSSYIGLFRMRGVAETLLAAHRFRRLRRALVTSARPGTFDREQIERYVESWSGPGRLTAMLSYYRALPHNRPIGRIATPAAILWGGRDAALGLKLAAAAAAQCDRARIHVRAQASHWLPLEEPAWMVERIGAFCGRDR